MSDLLVKECCIERQTFGWLHVSGADIICRLMVSRLSPVIVLLLALFLSSPYVAQRGGTFGGPAGLPSTVGGRSDLPTTTVSIQPPPITDLDTVLLTVNVTGPQNNSVEGISRDRFQVLEDGVEQQITYFWEDSRPITVGFIFDDSGRMATNDKVNVLKEAAQSFLKNKDSRDEFFMVRMSDFADVVTSFTTDVKNLPVNYPSIGETALYDGIYVGLSVIKEAANPRRLLVVITSGGDRCCSDNNKKTTEPMLKEFALKQNVEIYTLFVVDTVEDAESEFVHRDSVVLEDLALLTGGRMYNAPNAARGVEAITAEIARGLKTQYILGFKSTRPEMNGKRRGVKVKVSSPEGAPKLSVWTKSGYYTRKEK
jgi:Ca-activated chloride channel homolog